MIGCIRKISASTGRPRSQFFQTHDWSWVIVTWRTESINPHQLGVRKNECYFFWAIFKLKFELQLKKNLILTCFFWVVYGCFKIIFFEKKTRKSQVIYEFTLDSHLIFFSQNQIQSRLRMRLCIWCSTSFVFLFRFETQKSCMEL